MSDTGPLSDHEIANVLVSLPPNWTVVRACQELATFRSAVRAIVSDKTLTLDEVRQRLEELLVAAAQAAQSGVPEASDHFDRGDTQDLPEEP